ncbi:MAG: agmatinase [Lysobacterales bacterium]|jgi:agmatinase
MNAQAYGLNDVVLVGICSDANSSHMRGAAAAPAAIREVLHNGASNLWSETGVDIGGHPGFHDVGDLHVGDTVEEFLGIEGHIAGIVGCGALPLVLGGDHAITYPVLRAVYAARGPLNVLHFDAHPDLYHDYEGNPYSHASPFARALEDGLVGRLVQVGIRTLSAHLREQATRFGVEIHEMKDFDAASFSTDFNGPVFISLDLDAFDPAFAPGVSHHEPGGLSVREVLGIIQGLPNPIIGADIVELNPARDINGMTAAVAAKLVKEIAGKML